MSVTIQSKGVHDLNKRCYSIPVHGQRSGITAAAKSVNSTDIQDRIEQQYHQSMNWRWGGEETDGQTDRQSTLG